MFLLILQLSVLALAVTAHAASIATHSQQKRSVQTCQLHPRNYIYQNNHSQISQTSVQNCMLGEEMSVEYMNCSNPSILTDNQHGPETYNNTNQDQFYQIVHRNSQILFTFEQIEIVRDIKLYYYSDSRRNKILPRVYVHIVNEDFSIGNVPRKSRIAEGGPRVAPLDSEGLQFEIIQVNASAKKWLLSFDELQLEQQLYLSEVEFFHCTLTTVSAADPLPTTTESLTTATQVRTLKPTTPTTPPTDTPCTLHNDVAAHEPDGGATVQMLPWILMGLMTILFTALLTGNVICCMVCMANHAKKRKYELKRNPSYLSTTRDRTTVGTRNYGFENHIYDVPTT